MGFVDKLAFRRRWKAWVIGGVVALAVVVVGVPFAYIHFFNSDQPAALSLDSNTGTASAATVPDDGTWKVGAGSTTGYRVHEILAGQSTTAVGRTSSVTGDIVISGSQVTTGTFTVDMKTVKSDKSQRDGQFQGRIMQTATYPTATFTLTKPIELGSAPAAGKVVTATATGDLTLHGATKSVTFTVQAVRTGNTIKVQGSIPVTFSDYNISSPSFAGFVTVDDNGTMEFLLDFVPA